MKELQELIRAGEGDALDFKKRIGQPEKIARTLASFANTRGGIILVGVMDNGLVSGVDPEEEKHLLDQAAHIYCNPPVRIFYKELEEDDKTVLKVIIPESAQKPHLVKVGENDWRNFIRIKDETVQTDKASLSFPDAEPEPAPEKIFPEFEPAELQLLQFLKSNRRITLKQFSELVNFPERRAFETLIRMVLAGAIRLHDKEQEEDYYTLL